MCKGTCTKVTFRIERVCSPEKNGTIDNKKGQELNHKDKGKQTEAGGSEATSSDMYFLIIFSHTLLSKTSVWRFFKCQLNFVLWKLFQGTVNVS